MNHKISIIGAGNVGASCAQRIAEKGYADVVLLDVIEGLPQGKALDIMESAPICGFNSRVTGSNSYRDTAGSEVTVITSGSPRKPGMSRDQLLKANMTTVSAVVGNVMQHSPDGIIIMVTNPVDAMTQLALETSGFPRNRVLGLSGVLDGSRLGSFIAAELGAAVKDISTCILGQHGEAMVVVPRLCTVKGTPLTELLPSETIDKLVKRTVSGGAEIVALLKSGSAFYAPSAAVAQMAAAIVLDEKQTLPCAAYLEGEYGITGIATTVPVTLGRNGIEEIVALELTGGEKAALAASAEAVRELVKAMKSG